MSKDGFCGTLMKKASHLSRFLRETLRCEKMFGGSLGYCSGCHANRLNLKNRPTVGGLYIPFFNIIYFE